MRYEATLPAEAALALLTRPPLAIAPTAAPSCSPRRPAGRRGYTFGGARTAQPHRSLAPKRFDPVFSPDGAALLLAAGLELKTVRFGSGPATIAPIVRRADQTRLDHEASIGRMGHSGLMRMPPAAENNLHDNGHTRRKT